MNDFADYPPLYLEGIRLFNEREFFACHDALEELWDDTVGPERDFYQGLIQSAVALFHFGEGNLGGAIRLYHIAVKRLTPYGPQFFGIDVDRFLVDLAGCFRELLAVSAGYPDHLTLDESRVPTIELEEVR